MGKIKQSDRVFKQKCAKCNYELVQGARHILKKCKEVLICIHTFHNHFWVMRVMAIRTNNEIDNSD